MVTILYGLAGEGMGHATRSKVVVEHLLKRGHELHIVASNRAYDFLAKSFPNATRIPGLRLVYENNTVDKLKSLWTNLKPREGQEAVEIVEKIIRKEQPNIIITDYEPTVAHLAGMMSWQAIIGKKKIPLLSVDNMHVISNCRIEVPSKYWDDYAIVKYGNDLMVPPQNVSKYVITTFFYPEITRRDTVLVPSLVREPITKAKPKERDYILLYQTSQSNTAMLEVLKRFRRERFVIYGFNLHRKDHNLTFKKFSEEGFISDLAECKAAITNGGFTMMSEAVFLHKPIFSVPVKQQFEQICNAIHLDKEGYGEFHEELTYKGLSGFLYNLPLYKDNLKKYHQKDNSKALKTIDDKVRILSKAL
jgi:uncharacterized protein (TIGR00661 family)